MQWTLLLPLAMTLVCLISGTAGQGGFGPWSMMRPGMHWGMMDPDFLSDMMRHPDNNPAYQQIKRLCEMYDNTGLPKLSDSDLELRLFKHCENQGDLSDLIALQKAVTADQQLAKLLQTEG